MESSSPEGIIRIVNPGLVIDFYKEFIRDYPPYSITLDGAGIGCEGGTVIRHVGPYMNIDHHGERPIQERSTCKQALIYTCFGLHETTFQKDGEPRMNLYVNDCDQDVTLSTYVLEHPETATRPKMRRLVDLEDLFDMSAGLYLPNSDQARLAQVIAWINEPYTDARLSGELYTMSAGRMYALIDEVHERIRKYLLGKEKRLTLNKDFDVISEHDGWSFVREVGAQARTGMAEAKIRAYVVYKGEHDGRHHYALGRLHDGILFPLPRLWPCLNRAENIRPYDKYRWNGSAVCGGSPRKIGSALSPPEVAEVVDDCRKEWIASLGNGRSGEG